MDTYREDAENTQMQVLYYQEKHAMGNTRYYEETTWYRGAEIVDRSREEITEEGYLRAIGKKLQ